MISDANRGITPSSRMISDVNRGLVPAKRKDGRTAAPSAQAAKRPTFLSSFYDRELNYLGSWEWPQRGPSVRIIDGGTFGDIKRRGVPFPSGFAVAVPDESRDAKTGLHAGSKLNVTELHAQSKVVTIDSVKTQWVMIESLFAKAKASAEAVGKDHPERAREFVAYFVLDVIDARLFMVEATGVVMDDKFHATFDLPAVGGHPDARMLPKSMGGDTAKRVIGDVHTHYLLDPLIDTDSTTLGHTAKASRTYMVLGVSSHDLSSATKDKIVVYAVDSRYLHRAVPILANGQPSARAENKLRRSGDVLREALRRFGNEP